MLRNRNRLKNPWSLSKTKSQKKNPAKQVDRLYLSLITRGGKETRERVRDTVQGGFGTWVKEKRFLTGGNKVPEEKDRRSRNRKFGRQQKRGKKNLFIARCVGWHDVGAEE